MTDKTTPDSTDTDRLAEAEKHIRAKIDTRSRDSLVVNGAALALVMTEFDRLLSDLADERAARCEAEDAYGRVAIDATDRLSLVEQLQKRLDAANSRYSDVVLKVSNLRYDDVDGAQFTHEHADGDGPECAGCWAEAIDEALGLGEEADSDC